MEVREYETPTSWNDKGMDWNNPDLTSVDYIMALKEAIIERYSIYTKFNASTLKAYVAPLYQITPYSPIDIDQLDDLIYSLNGLNNILIDNMEDCQTLSISNLWAEEGCGTFNPELYRGEADLQALVPWFKAVKNVINKLTLITSVTLFFRCRTQVGTTGYSFGWSEELGRNAYLYSEDVQDAFDSALSNLYFSTDERKYIDISYFYGQCAMEDTLGSGMGIPYYPNIGYEAEVKSMEFYSDGTFRMHTSASCNLIFKYTPVPPNNSSSSVYDYNYWQDPATAPPEVVYCKDGLIPEFQIGDINDFPYSGQVPPATQDLCVKYYYNIETFADFGISDGFKFQ